MDPTIKMNKRVDVVAIYHRNGDINTLAMPHKMIYNHQEIIFTQLGMRHPTVKGKRMIHVFDMFDGANCYRLEFDAEGLLWTLTAVVEGSSV